MKKRILLGCMIFFINTLLAFDGPKTVYIIPFAGFEKNDLLFDATQRDGCLKPFCALKEALIKLGYHVQLTHLDQPLTDIHTIVVFDIPEQKILEKLSAYAHKPLLLYLWEPPTISLRNFAPSLHTIFSAVYTMADDLVDTKKYHKFYYPQPSLTPLEKILPFNTKKLCTLIACNKTSPYSCQLYTERYNTINFFEHYAADDFDFYGFGWPADHFKTYKGTVSTKQTTLEKYRFCICYENTQFLQGYITEKIFDCFVAGCVPVYWGADNIEYYIPEACFIDRRKFSSHEDLYKAMKNMPEEVYQGYLDRIALFLQSPQAHFFSTNYFIETFLKSIDKNYDKNKLFIDDECTHIKMLSVDNKKN